MGGGRALYVLHIGMCGRRDPRLTLNIGSNAYIIFTNFMAKTFHSRALSQFLAARHTLHFRHSGDHRFQHFFPFNYSSKVSSRVSNVTVPETPIFTLELVSEPLPPPPPQFLTLWWHIHVPTIMWGKLPGGGGGWDRHWLKISRGNI